MNPYNLANALRKTYRLPITNVTYNWENSNSDVTYYNVFTESGRYFTISQIHKGMAEQKLDTTNLEDHIRCYYPELLI